MVVLNHAFVPAHDRVSSGQWFAGMFGVPYVGGQGGRPVARVRLNETLALDFVERERFEPNTPALRTDLDTPGPRRPNG